MAPSQRSRHNGHLHPLAHSRYLSSGCMMCTTKKFERPESRKTTSSFVRNKNQIYLLNRIIHVINVYCVINSIKYPLEAINHMQGQELQIPFWQDALLAPSQLSRGMQSRIDSSVARYALYISYLPCAFRSRSMCS